MIIREFWYIQKNNTNRQQSPFLTREIWSRLPIELLREIILYLASTSLRTARQIRLVSRHTNVWVLPLLFHTLTLTTPDHVVRFASTLLPKRKIHIPALKSTLHTSPRALSSYNVESLALVVNARLPSVEIALANVAPAFTHVKNFVTTAQNLSSNAHWIRQHPIRPQHMMILHFGLPHTVNYREPVFDCVTHLYTSVLAGHRGTSVLDLPRLTHLAVHTRVTLPELTALAVIDQILETLEALPNLEHFVLVLGSSLVYDPSLEKWKTRLEPCVLDKRFTVLPYFRDLKLEWQDMVEGRYHIWERAKAWCSVADEDDLVKIRHRSDIWKTLRMEHSLQPRKPLETTWEIDLVQRDNYSSYEGDPVERSEDLFVFLFK